MDLLKEEKVEMKKVEKLIWIGVKTETLTKTTKKLENWKAPGSDQVCNFLIKHLHALHPITIDLYNFCIKNPL